MNEIGEWKTLITVAGPASIRGIDVDNPLNAPVQTRLVRDSGSILLHVLAPPLHQHAVVTSSTDLEAEYSRPLWEPTPDTPIVVPENQSVSLMVRASRDFHGYIGHYFHGYIYCS